MQSVKMLASSQQFPTLAGVEKLTYFIRLKRLRFDQSSVMRILNDSGDLYRALYPAVEDSPVCDL